MSSIADKVKEIVVEQLGVSEDQVTPEAKFIEDLGADSLDQVELVMALEEKFGFAISDKAAEKKLFDPSLAAYRDEKTILDFVHCIAEIVKMEDSEAKK